MPHRNRDKIVKFLPNTPTTSLSQPSLFSSDSELEEPIGELPKIYEDPIIEEEQETIPLETMAENKNVTGNGKRTEGSFHILETNGDTKMKKISPLDLPHFHGLTTEDRDTFLFKFVVLCQKIDT